MQRLSEREGGKKVDEIKAGEKRVWLAWSTPDGEVFGVGREREQRGETVDTHALAWRTVTVSTIDDRVFSTSSFVFERHSCVVRRDPELNAGIRYTRNL